MPWTIADMEPRLVSTDGVEAPEAHAFWGWILKDHRWNGFAIPFFNLTQAQAVAKMTHENDLIEDEGWVFMPDGRLFQVYPVHAGDAPEEIKPVEVEGIEGPLYPIGAWNWTWMETVEFGAGLKLNTELLDKETLDLARDDFGCPYDICAGYGRYEDSSPEDGPMAGDVQYCSCHHAGRAILQDRVREAGF